jgi:hypothetical protein
MSKKQKTAEYLAILAAAALAVVLLAVGVFAQTGTLRFFGPLSRILTPNGDHVNDLAIFCFDNPADSDISGKVYTLLGTEVGSMGPRTRPALGGCPAGFDPQSVTWDGKANGQAVRSGVYVYRIASELKVYTGTLIVVK